MDIEATNGKVCPSNGSKWNGICFVPMGFEDSKFDSLLISSLKLKRKRRKSGNQR